MYKSTGRLQLCFQNQKTAVCVPSVALAVSEDGVMLLVILLKKSPLGLILHQIDSD